MTDTDSLIKARYALSLLKVARRSGRDDAIRLFDGLMAERPHADTSAEIADAHRTVVRAIALLARAVRENSASDNLWNATIGAVEAWRQLADRQDTDG